MCTNKHEHGGTPQHLAWPEDLSSNQQLQFGGVHVSLEHGCKSLVSVSSPQQLGVGLRRFGALVYMGV